MAKDSSERKFEARIPTSAADRLDSLMEEHDLSNKQILKAMIRVFLSAPEPIRAWALYGNENVLDTEGIRRAWASLFQQPLMTPEEFVEGAARTLQDTAAKRGGKKAASA